MIYARNKHILFSGDRGNDNLPDPYPKPDDEGLEDSADFLILESTYGGREHNNREKELVKMDKIIINAIARNEDIIIPIISLDRPVIVAYEIITRLIKTGVISSDKVEMLYFGNLLEKLMGLIPPNHPMKKAIKKYIKTMDKNMLDSLEKK